MPSGKPQRALKSSRRSARIHFVISRSGVRVTPPAPKKGRLVSTSRPFFASLAIPARPEDIPHARRSGAHASCVSSSMGRRTLAGTPPTTTLSGTSWVTTAPAATTSLRQASSEKARGAPPLTGSPQRSFARPRESDGRTRRESASRSPRSPAREGHRGCPAPGSWRASRSPG